MAPFGADGTHWMLVTDVDDTLTGDDEALAELVAAIDAAGTIRLVLDSSRPLASVGATLAGLPVDLAPDAVVGALGTEIEVDGGPDAGWRRRYEGWDRRVVDEVMAALGWPPHPPELQTAFKASFSVPAAARLESERRLAGAGVDARYLYGDDDHFDVIPSNAGKHAPLGHLAERLAVDPGRIVAAGDGSNDLDLLVHAPRAVAVGNATPALLEALDGGPAYLAQASHAAGVLEGLRAHGVLAGGS